MVPVESSQRLTVTEGTAGVAQLDADLAQRGWRPMSEATRLAILTNALRAERRARAVSVLVFAFATASAVGALMRWVRR
jgi:hypothetical protein